MELSKLRCDYVKKTTVHCVRMGHDVHFSVIKKNYGNYTKSWGQCDELPILVCEGCVYRRDNGWVPFDNNIVDKAFVLAKEVLQHSV